MLELKKNKYTKRNIKFMIGTSNEGYWNLLQLLEHECKLIDLDYNYAKETFDAIPLISGLKKLNKNSLSNLTPHPAYVFVYYSHPTLLQRYHNMKNK